MSVIQSKVVATGLLFVAIFGSGVWLSNSGRPLNTALFTVHKLASVAAIVLIAMMVRQLNGQAKLSALEIGAIALTAVFFVLTIAVGGYLSLAKPVPAVALTAHKITPVLTVLSTALTVYLLARGR